jgi:hypothetical protein
MRGDFVQDNKAYWSFVLYANKEYGPNTVFEEESTYKQRRRPSVKKKESSYK